MLIIKVGLVVAMTMSFLASSVASAWALDSRTGQLEGGQQDAFEFDHPEPACLMSVHGALRWEKSQVKKSSNKLFCLRLEENTPLTGSVEGNENSDPFSKISYRLMETALDRNPNVRMADKAVQRYQRVHEKAIANSKDALDKLIGYRGFGPSSQAGDVLLEEKLKLDNLQAAEYVRQKQVDDAHLETVKILMHLATTFGIENPEHKKQAVDRGITELTKLVGDDEARRVVGELEEWSKAVNIPPDVYEKESWDPLEFEKKHTQVVAVALDRDPVYQKVKEKLRKYNHKSKGTMAASHIIEGTLGVASLAPNVVGPAAQAAMTVFEMATGGPEEAKLIKEIYLYKRLESRARVHAKKAEMALHNYQIGVATKNPLQIAFAQAMVSEMSGADTVQDVFGYSLLQSEE